jgi:hypothetical protein
LLVVEDVGVIVISPTVTVNCALVPPAARAEPVTLVKVRFINAALPVVAELEIVTELRAPTVTLNVPGSLAFGGLGSVIPVCVTPYVNAVSVVVDDVGATTKLGTALLNGRGVGSSGIECPAIVLAIETLSRLFMFAGPVDPS